MIRNQFQLYAAAYGLTLVACILSWLLLRILLEGTSLPVEIYASLTSDLSQRWIITSALICFPLAWLFARASYSGYLAQGVHANGNQIDPLSGLLNRTAFCELAEDRLRMHGADANFGLLLLDPDYFGELSETYGYKVADTILTQMTHRLNTAVRDGDMLCRIEGEKFALFAKCHSVDQLYLLADRLVSVVAEKPYSADGSIIEISASCGLADTWGYGEFDDLMLHARKALLQAKRNRFANNVTDAPDATDTLEPTAQAEVPPELI